MKTNVLVKHEKQNIVIDGQTIAVDNYQIDNENGWLPAVEHVEEQGRVLIVCTHAIDFDFLNKIIVWAVKEFVWNISQSKWIELVGANKTNKFAQMYPYSTLTVSNENFVTPEGVPCNANDIGAIGEADYYIDTLGKQIIFPSIQASIQTKLQ